MSVGGCFLKNGVFESKSFDDTMRGKVEYAVKDFGDPAITHDLAILIFYVCSAKGIYVQANMIFFADGIGYLYKCLIGHACSNEVLGHMAHGVSSGTVNL